MPILSTGTKRPPHFGGSNMQLRLHTVVCLSINQSINQSITQSINQSITQSINQVIQQSVDQNSLHQPYGFVQYTDPD